MLEKLKDFIINTEENGKVITLRPYQDRSYLYIEDVLLDLGFKKDEETSKLEDEDVYKFEDQSYVVFDYSHFNTNMLEVILVEVDFYDEYLSKEIINDYRQELIGEEMTLEELNDNYILGNDMFNYLEEDIRESFVYEKYLNLSILIEYDIIKESDDFKDSVIVITDVSRF